MYDLIPGWVIELQEQGYATVKAIIGYIVSKSDYILCQWTDSLGGTFSMLVDS